MQWTYIITYLILALWIIFIVGARLYNQGASYLKALFPSEGLDLYINRLLLTGYYLINAGYAVYNLVQHRSIDSSAELISLVAHNIGFLCLLLGSIHFGNIIILFQLSKSILTSKNN